MNRNRSLLVLLQLLAAAVIGLWALSPTTREAVQPKTPLVSAPRVVDAADAADVAPAVAQRPEPGAAQPQRTEIAPSAAASGPALVGQVVDEHGQPVAQAVVECAPGLSFGHGSLADVDLAELARDFDPMAWRQQQERQLQQLAAVTADADGRFRLAPAGTMTSLGLRVKARGFALLDRAVRRPVGTDTDLGALQLQRGAVVQGRVLDRQGIPVANASVMCPRQAQEELFGRFALELPQTDEPALLRLEGGVVTDAAGRFELQHVEAGEFTLRAWHWQHPPARRQGLQARAGQTLSDVVIELEPGVLIRGRVVGAPAGVPGLQVLAAAVKPADSGNLFAALTDELLRGPGLGFADRKVEAGADGSFALHGLHADRSYRVWAAQDGQSLSGSVPCSKPVEVAAGSTGVELQYELGITVTFVAVDAKTQAPIEQLWVEHELRGGGSDFGDLMQRMPGAGRRARHYPGGRVELEDLRPKPEQTLALTVEATGFRRLQRQSIALPAQGRVDLGTLALAPAPVVQVTVLDGGSGRPVAGASVRLQAPEGGRPDPKALWGGGADTGRSDADGRCTLNVPADADHVVVHVDQKPYAAYASAPLAIAGPQTLHEARLLRGGSVEVAVVDADGAPLVDASVEHRAPADADDQSLQAMMARMSGDRHKTDGNGVARFDRLQPGEHRFRLGSGAADNPMAMAFAAASGQGDDGGWQTVVVVDGGEAKLQLQKQPTAGLHGIVREDGVPLAGARVAFVDGEGGDAQAEMAAQMMAQMMGGKGGHSTRSDDHGSYRLADLPPGAHRLRVTHAERAMPATFAVTLRGGDQQFDLDLDGNSLRGTVRDPQGKPIAGATVRARRAPAAGADPREQAMDAIGETMAGMLPGSRPDGGAKAVTDEAGAYELRGVETGVPLVVRAEAKGFAPASSAPVEVERAGSRTGVDVALLAAGSIEVKVAKGGGMAMVMASWAGDDPGAAPVMQMLRNGSTTLRDLRPGKWKVVLQGMGMQSGEPAGREVEVEAGGTAVVEFGKQ